MVQTKKMNESVFAKLLKDFNVVGELIRARQDEKQAIMDQFVAENKRFYFGKISENALASSVRKTNKELARLDKEIRKAISRSKDLSDRARKLTADQAPRSIKATLSGISSGANKKVVKKKVVKKKTAKKKVVKKKVVKKKTAKKKIVLTKAIKKKELALDRKYSKKKKR